MTYIVTAINEDILARKIEIVKQEINKNNENIKEKGWQYFNDEPTSNIVKTAIRTEAGLQAYIFFREKRLMKYGLPKTR